MSQSDYIKHKRNAHILKRQTDLDSILNSKDLTQYKEFQLMNTIENTFPTYNQLKLSNKQPIFSMEIPVNNCSEFIVCSNTNNRPNRVLTMTDAMGKRGYKQRNAMNEYFVNQKVNNLILPCKMFSECEKFYYLRENPYEDEETTIIVGGT